MYDRGSDETLTLTHLLSPLKSTIIIVKATGLRAGLEGTAQKIFSCHTA